jgi:DNA-binding SARP family transcriptional activator
VDDTLSVHRARIVTSSVRGPLRRRRKGVRVIEVSLLGPPRVERAGALVGFDTRKAVALLAHLALADRPRPRDALADLLWPDNDIEHARGALRRTLSTLRAAIGPESLETTRDHLRLIKSQNLSVDVDRFRTLVTEGDLETAAGMFRGDFLEGFGLRDAPDFEDWARNQADTLRRELTGVLARLAAGLEEAGHYSAALVHVRRWLSLDPYTSRRIARSSGCTRSPEIGPRR